MSTELDDSLESKGYPILKWVGGKRQLLPVLLPKVPKHYGRYIEPFFGGGAMFFAIQPDNAIIADVNPELINMYEQVAFNVEDVIEYLREYENTEEVFFAVRALDWERLPAAEAAARMIFLNKTCFNGLYRLNKKGKFNTPYGKYKKPNFCNEFLLRAASNTLKKAKIICDSYENVLLENAQAGDFIFLDPPYVPMAESSIFNGYTKDQFLQKDQVKLADTVNELYDRGCYVLLTNSNHELIHELYGFYSIEIIPTQRKISCRPDARRGEDILVTIDPLLRQAI